MPVVLRLGEGFPTTRISWDKRGHARFWVGARLVSPSNSLRGSSTLFDRVDFKGQQSSAAKVPLWLGFPASRAAPFGVPDYRTSSHG